MIKYLKDTCSKCNKIGRSQQCILVELPLVLMIGEQSSYFNEIEIPFQLDMEKLIKNCKNYSIRT